MVIKIEDKYYVCTTNSLSRWLVLRNYFYSHRVRVNGKYQTYFYKSKLLDELLTLYSQLKAEGSDEINTYKSKLTQKAE